MTPPDTGNTCGPGAKKRAEVTEIHWARHLLLPASIFAFVFSICLPFVPGPYNKPFPGLVMLLFGAEVSFWWANPLLVAAWVCGYRRWSASLTVCSIAALMLGLSALLWVDTAELYIGYHIWILSLALATLASLVAPTKHAGKMLRRFLARPQS